MDVDGIKITPYRAGHVLGAAMFMVEIGGMRLLYTGKCGTCRDAGHCLQLGKGAWAQGD